MSVIGKKSISRRTVLRGIGTAIALPLLDAMVPALSVAQNTAAKPIQRFGVVYHPNGIIYDKWLPKGVGTEFEFSPILAPLEPFRDKVVVVTGLYSDQAEALGDGGGDHSRASGTYLTGVHVKRSDTVVENGISMDQIAAKTFERETQLSSLQLTVDDASLVGACDVGYSCAYSSTLSWLTPTLPLMAENNPRVVFDRLFGGSDSSDPRVRAARLQQDRSILDSVTERVRALQRRLGPGDNRKVNDYLESLRDVERRIQNAETQSVKEAPDVQRPEGIPDGFEPHVKLLYDLQLLAFQSDLARVISFMIGKEQSARPYPQIGVPEAHHPLSHHNDLPELIAQMSKINRYHAQLFSQYLAKLRATPDGDGMLLDHVTILYGAGISNSQRHSGDNLPLMLVGGSSGRIKGGRHIKYTDKPMMANLLVTLMDKMDVPIDHVGGSTGKLQIDTLSGV